jgi:uncharacterized protein (TIGR02001 family)
MKTLLSLLEETSMKLTKNLLASAVAALASASFLAPVANSEVAATVGVANMYYWRGLNLGNGDAQVSGDLKFSESGFYAGIWGGSGDASGGTEYDIYAGYGGGEADGFNYDISLWTYTYPQNSDAVLSDPGKLSEAVLALGYGPVKLTYYSNLADQGDTVESSYSYLTLAFTYEQFSILFGAHNDLGLGDGVTYGSPTHVDLSYAYSDRLKFTIGKMIDDDDVFKTANAAKFIASYSLPLGE